jgi:hypothetical protein
MEVIAMNTLTPFRRTAAVSTLVIFLLWGSLPLAVAESETISPPANRVPAVWLSPRILDPAEAGIGKLVPDLELQGIEGQNHRLYGPVGRRGTVIVVRDPDCPVSRRYGPRISKLARQFSDDGYGFVFIYPNEELQTKQRTQDAERLGAPGLYVDRGSFALADALGVKSTGDVFILDADHRLRYRGAVDDQYGLGYTRDLPSQHYLRNALESLQQGREVETPATAAPGCYIDADPAKDRLFQQLPGGQMLS